MATNLALIFIFFILVDFPIMIMSQVTCPYPCYPFPTGGGGSTPIGVLPPPPPPPPPVIVYPPPTGYYPSPSGNLPFYPSPPFVNYYGPPPPDPILPYFPFYYRKPPHQTDDSFSIPRLSRSSVMTVVAANVLATLCLFLVL